jgi:hypothetical protein
MPWQRESLRIDAAAFHWLLSACLVAVFAVLSHALQRLCTRFNSSAGVCLLPGFTCCFRPMIQRLQHTHSGRITRCHAARGGSSRRRVNVRQESCSLVARLLSRGSRLSRFQALHQVLCTLSSCADCWRGCSPRALPVHWCDILLPHSKAALTLETAGAGDANGKGPLRRKELPAACAVLGVPAHRVEVIDKPELQVLTKHLRM